MPLIVRTLLLIASCGLFALGGFQLSSSRASDTGRAPRTIAAAGGEAPGILGGGSLTSADDRYRLSSLSVFSNVALHVKDHYVDPERIKPREMLLRALEEIERQIAEVLVEEISEEQIRIEVMGKRKLVSNDVQNLWEINLKLREVFRFFEKHLPPQDDVRLIEYAAVNGALSTLDPHSILLKPEAYADMKTSTKGEFGGLGIVISVRDGKLTIISPIDDTPAARAGLKAGDIISRIGEVSTISMPVNEAVRMLRGPKGSKVTIWVDRTGWSESRRFSIVRERIKLESVESQLLSGRIGIIKIKNFQQNTGKDLEEHLDKLKTKAKGQLHGLILDLRNNPGGLLEQATRVSDQFISSGDIVTTVGYGNKLREPKRARWSGTETDLPLVVLVNRGSASASEIVAGALKNLDRATIVGETTFGKGSVQVLYDFSDSSALKLTIAQYLTPGDISIQNDGVPPDIRLKPAWLESNSVRGFYEDDGHRESSLDKHLDNNGGLEAEKSRPRFGFSYLVQSDDDPDGHELAKEESALDFPVRFARDFLLAAGAPTRSQTLARGRRFLTNTAAKEEQAAIERLAELGVDWSAPPRKLRRAPRLDVELTLEDADEPGVIRAGEPVKLRATVTNVGDIPVYRLHGTLRSDNPAFEGREMMFGRISPGDAKSWTVHTRVPREESSRTDPVRLVLEAEGSELATEATTSVTTQFVKKPRFAFTWVFDDRERGDGDGLLEMGEGIDFDVLVTNIGAGEAENVALRLKSAAHEDLFLERGRAKVGRIGPGETRRGSLRFRIPEKQSERGSLPLELAVYDSQSGEWLESQFDLQALKQDARAVTPARGRVRARRPTTLLRGARKDAAVVGVLSRGAVLPTEARTGPFTRVRLPSGAPAFVRTEAVRKTKVSPPAGTQPGIAYQPNTRPPEIALNTEPSGKVYSSDRLRLEGTIRARSLRDMFVLLNDDKVYFERAVQPAKLNTETRAIDGWRAPDDEGAQLAFSVPLKLEDGLNKIVVVARLDEKVVSHRTLYVSKAGATAVAEHVNKKTPAIGPPKPRDPPR